MRRVKTCSTTRSEDIAPNLFKKKMTIATTRELNQQKALLKKGLMDILNSNAFDDLCSEWKAQVLLDLEGEFLDKAEAGE